VCFEAIRAPLGATSATPSFLPPVNKLERYIQLNDMCEARQKRMTTDRENTNWTGS
jgi:hypothetical protein